MSFMDKLKAMFGGSSDTADDHSGHDHSAHEHAPPATPADPAGMSTSEPQPSEPQAVGEDEDRPA